MFTNGEKSMIVFAMATKNVLSASSIDILAKHSCEYIRFEAEKCRGK